MRIKINPEEVNIILGAIDDLIDIKIILRQVTPDYNFNEEQINKIKQLLKSVHIKLQPFFYKYLNLKSSADNSTYQEQKSQSFIKGLIKDKRTILISTNTFKKKLKKLGMDPRKLLVTGGPLFARDYKKVNPDLSEEDLLVIKEKCERLHQKIKDKEEPIVFLFKKRNLTDQIILNELKSIKSKYNIKIESFPLSI